MAVKLILSESYSSDVGVGVEFITTENDLIKKASCEIFNKSVDELKPPKGYLGTHLAALGDYEHFGFNRNFDAFRKKACEKYHHTFVENGTGFRNHNNKDPRLAIGKTVASAYNEKMGRIELFTHWSEKDAAAELEHYEKTGELPFSMACYVPGDYCSICGNFRKNASDPDQCEHISFQFGKLASDGSIVGTFNRDPNWFDISMVTKPADRIAWALSSMKAASIDDKVVDSITLAKLADIYIPDKLAITDEKAIRRKRYLEKIAKNLKMHISWSKGETRPISITDCFNFELRKAASCLSDNVISIFQSNDPNIVIPKLAEAGVVMSPKDFFKYLNSSDIYDSKLVKKAAASIPSIIIDAVDNSRCGDICNDEIFELRNSIGFMPVSTLEKAGRSTGIETVRDRILENTLIKKFDKRAEFYLNSSTSLEMKGLAEKYAAYVLSTIDKYKNLKNEEDNLCSLAAVQILYN